MKALTIFPLFFVSLTATAAINQTPVVVDEPVIFVRASQQDNGVAKVDALLTEVTRGVTGSLVPASGFVAQRSVSGGGAPNFTGGVPSVESFSAPTITTPKVPVIPAPVPEPETYALMAMGLLALIAGKKRKG